jgi:uncharacterized membrane protein YfhO
VVAVSLAHASEAQVTRFEPERIAVRTRAPAPGILVLAEAWYPGWSATIAGTRAEVFPVNGWMRGVVVPAGAHDVIFTYHSRFLAVGIGVSALSAAALVILLARGVRGTPDAAASAARAA